MKVEQKMLAIANGFVENTNLYNQKKPYSERISMTVKRLQKLIYFAEIRYMLEREGEQLFDTDYCAWPSGAVIPEIYHQYVQRQGEVAMNAVESSYILNDFTRDIIDDVFKKTIEIDTLDLVNMTLKKGTPWAAFFNSEDDRHKQIIPKVEIYNYYSKHPKEAI